MSSVTTPTAASAPAGNRRAHVRCALRTLAYVRCGADNGGILMNIGEGGLRFQGVGTLTGGEEMDLQFILPSTLSPIEARGRVVWCNDSRKGGGLVFLELSATAREQIRKWISLQPAAPIFQGQPAVPAAGVASLAADALAAPASPPIEAAGGQDDKASFTRTPFSDGLRRIHTVAPSEADGASDSEVVKFPGPSVADSVVAASQPQRQRPPQAAPENGVPELTYALIGAAVLIVILAAVIGFYGYSYFRSSGAQAPQAADVPAKDFQVEVIDLNNRRSLLANAGATSALSPAAAASPAGAQQARQESARNAVPSASGANSAAPSVAQTAATAPAGAALDKNPSSLALQAPRVVKSPAADGQNAAVADTLAAPSSSLDPRGLDPRVLDPRVLVAAPEAPAPPRPGEASSVAAAKPGAQPAVVVKRVQPLYPPVARQLRIQGIVQIQASIDRDGVPHELKLLSGDPRLASPALDAVRQWRYKPAMLDGQPVESETTIQLEFRFQDN